MQLGAAADHKTDGFIIARGWKFGIVRPFVLPKTHRDVNARSEILLPHLPFRRILRLYLLDACISHFASCRKSTAKKQRARRILGSCRARVGTRADRDGRMRKGSEGGKKGKNRPKGLFLAFLPSLIPLRAIITDIALS